MPVFLHSNQSDPERRPGTPWLFDEPSAEFQEQSSKCITIGLINNMPDGALEATERQFLSLLDAASDGILIRLALYALPGVPRNEFGARHVKEFYASADNLLDTHLDGLIVTGREPLRPNLADEPYWASFTRVLEWAKDNTHSTVWSCLAAHAAVLHMDGIGRIKSNDKHCGVFECTRVSDHALAANAPALFTLPHSRWNGVPEKALTRHGYTVVTRTEDAGVDTFVKQLNSLFVFFQGHPEYESDTLLLEYRRDAWRFLKGETEKYPTLPRRYFDRHAAHTLTALREEALLSRREELLAKVSTALANIRIENTWRDTAASIYKNWLDYICAQKELRLKGARFPVQSQGAADLTPVLSTAMDAPAPGKWCQA
jgi:homoserine O-succinyltransferase